MSAESDNQVRAFKFIKAKFNSQELFTEEEFQRATGYSKVSFKTYSSKQFRGLMIPTDERHFRISAVFRQFSTWKKFKDKVVTQNRNFGRSYSQICYENVIVFEFYMPLRNEEYLRQTLDSLFYKDSVLFRLKLIKPSDLHKAFPKGDGEDEPQYFERICEFISDKFVGYSVNHVNGRYRATDIKTMQEALTSGAASAERYLVDETTAVVRFIFPCKAKPEKPESLLPPNEMRSAEPDANLIRWFFMQLFVQSILEVVNAEDEIWLLETGMRNRLHIWRAKD
ncbi:MAG: hypothetical protein KGJ88_07915 [Verrucomicrobiota bacterium]|nr:hypothetical protein [Verrucomicrobiota bacterium]